MTIHQAVGTFILGLIGLVLLGYHGFSEPKPTDDSNWQLYLLKDKAPKSTFIAVQTDDGGLSIHAPGNQFCDTKTPKDHSDGTPHSDMQPVFAEMTYGNKPLTVWVIHDNNGICTKYKKASKKSKWPKIINYQAQIKT